MHQLSASVTSRSLSLDSWSGMYVGAHWMVTKELPPEQWQFRVHHGPLCQMVVLSSHHLIELMLFKCLKTLLDANPGKHQKLLDKFPKAMFHEAFYEWPEKLIGAPFDLDAQPFKSASLLHFRRNATIHKESALATLEMAWSALFTAVHASRAICETLLGAGTFLYEPVLAKYSMQDAKYFSEVKLLERHAAT